jgi:hypothetical protein
MTAGLKERSAGENSQGSMDEGVGTAPMVVVVYQGNTVGVLEALSLNGTFFM